MVYGWGNTVSISNGLKPNVCAALECRPGSQSPHIKGSEPKISSGSQAFDPIMVGDDDEPDPMEINYIDLEDGDEAWTNKNITIPIKQAVVENHGLGFQSEARSRSPYNNIEQSDPARHTEKGTRPLFRTLTQDAFSASSAHSVPEVRGMGFKACYRTLEPDHAGSAAPTVLPKKISQTPSITMLNREHTKKTARKDRDAPQFAMSVLNSKRKRTMGELGYDQLISPAQVESPSEKLARIAKKRRQRDERCDPESQNTNASNVQSAIDFNHVRGRENDKETVENVEVAVSRIEYERLDRQEAVTRLGIEDSVPLVVREPSPVSICLSTQGQEYHHIKQRRGDESNGCMDVDGIRSTQTTTPDIDARGHGDGINAAKSSGCPRRKRTNRKPRVGGPTKVCGVFSPEKKPPVKRSNRGDFHCPRCDSQFTLAKGVNYHFEECIARYGNPKSLKWNDHPSLEQMGKCVVPRNINEQMITIPALAPAPASGVEEDSTRSGRRSDPITDIVPRSPASNTQASGLLRIPAKRPVTEEQASSAGNEPRLDHQMSIVEHRATGGKGLSSETLKAFQETGHWDYAITTNQNVGEDQDEETETPNIAYQYFVQKREWLETEEDAIESSMGPYYTLNEANAIAKAEVQCPQIERSEGFQSKGWSYYYRQDEHGMQVHMATIMEINIEAAVHRELAPANKRAWIPASAFVVAQHVYIVHELQWVPSPEDTTSTAPTQCQSLTHGVCTLLKRANQRAAAEYLESLTGNWGNSEYDQLRKMETKSDLDKKVRVLNREDDCFCEEIKLGDDGFAKVWVELVTVEGPRN